jgi:hypothetical protein
MFREIITHYDPPPIPTRQFDWVAVYADDLGENFAGYGANEYEARVDLLKTTEETEDDV